MSDRLGPALEGRSVVVTGQRHWSACGGQKRNRGRHLFRIHVHARGSHDAAGDAAAEGDAHRNLALLRRRIVAPGPGLIE